MLSLEEIMRRFVIRREGDPPLKAIEPVTQAGQSPVILNGMAEMLRYLAEQDKRISALESEIHQRHNP